MAKKTKTAEYNDASITSLKGADRVRKRPAVIFGSDGLEGCEHSIFEILSNSVDEAREGHGDEIRLTRFLDGSVQVEDFGRGIPLDYNESEGRYNWELVYCELFAGGKYNNDEGEAYTYSLGLNGLGACATQYASEFMDVTVYTRGFKYSLHFEKGENVGGLHKEPYSGRRTGSIQRWKPDLEVFTDTNVPLDSFRDMLRRQSIVNAGIRFVLLNELERGKFETEEFYYQRGIEEYVEKLVGEEALTPVHSFSAERRGRDRADLPDYKVRMETTVCFSNKNPLTEYYHNASWLSHGGAPDKAARSATVAVIDGWLRQNGKYSKSDGNSRITFADVEDCLVLVISSFSTRTSYENQTKKAINNAFIQQALTEFLREQLQVLFLEHPDQAEKACAQVLINKRAREKAESERVTVKTKLTAGLDISNRVQKLVDCRSRDVSRRELYIVEGDSAMGSCKLGRDAEFQAVIPVRGKTLNCVKASLDRILKSDIITDLIKVLGCGIDVGNRKVKGVEPFKPENLRWSKVIICTDADEDGYQIRALILTLFYTLMPELIRQGKIYIAETPLFEISCKDQIRFAYNEGEKDKILAEFEGKGKITVQRSKGLGENQPDMMWQTTMCPATRRLVQVMPSDAEATARMFDVLLGDDLEGRKEFIALHGARYLDLADI